MAAAGMRPQSFEWPDLDQPLTLTEVCGSTPTSSRSFDVTSTRCSGSPSRAVMMPRPPVGATAMAGEATMPWAWTAGPTQVQQFPTELQTTVADVQAVNAGPVRTMPAGRGMHAVAEMPSQYMQN
mmetsp:Transcript_59035/g.108537  ORF Transcript_59035/g.108537 Transcript_59035/m.108537 type:complete len:125 (+) Transcript_59035:1-375(+)